MIKGINYCSFEGGLEGKCLLKKAIENCISSNYKALELNYTTEGIINPFLSKNECLMIRNYINKSNIIVNSISSGMSWDFNPTSLDINIREKSFDLHKKAIMCSSNLGLKSLLFVPGIVNSPISTESVPYPLAMKFAKEMVDKLLIISEKFKIELCLENVWNGLFLSPLEFKNFIDKYNSNYLGCYFDVGNVLKYDQNPVDWIYTLKSVIKRIQIKDFKKKIGTLDGFCDLLAGDVPWKEVITALRNIKYESTIIAEMIPWDMGVIERTSVAMDLILGLK